jgi:hypothetical protein
MERGRPGSTRRVLTISCASSSACSSAAGELRRVHRSADSPRPLPVP